MVIDQGSDVVARLFEPPYEAFVDLDMGVDLRLRVVGLPQNLLGPWHHPARRRGWGGEPDLWSGPDVRMTPEPGDAYDLIDLGLLEPPMWWETTDNGTR